jgi:hypothetical protein
MMKLNRTTTATLLFLASLGFAGCSGDGPAEEAGETMDEAVDDAGDALENAADDLEDAVE